MRCMHYPLLLQLLSAAYGRSAHPTAPRQFPANKFASFCLGAFFPNVQGNRPQVSAPLRSVLNVCHWHTAPTNIRNPLIYCVNRYCLRSASVGAKRTSTGCSAPHVWRVPSSKALSCKHERLFDLLTLVSYKFLQMLFHISLELIHTHQYLTRL